MEMEKKEGFSHFKAYFEVLDYISDHAAFDPFLFPDNVKNPFLEPSSTFNSKKILTLFTKEGREAKKQKKGIEKRLLKEKKEYNNMLRILVLGVNGCGITTIFKQLKLSYQLDYSETERIKFISQVRINILYEFKNFFNYLKFYGTSIPPEIEKIVNEFKTLDFHEFNWNSSLIQKLKIVFDIYRKQINTSRFDSNSEVGPFFEYFIENIDRIGSDSYIPTTADILRVRRIKRDYLNINVNCRSIQDLPNQFKQNYFSNLSNDIILTICKFLSPKDVLSLGSTNKNLFSAIKNPLIWKYFWNVFYPLSINQSSTDLKQLFLQTYFATRRENENAIQEIFLEINGCKLKGFSYKFPSFISCARQRNEKRKWIHSFENILGVIFVADISVYNKHMEGSNFLIEQISFFKSIVNSRFFKNTPLILFLNKVDLFKEKCQKFSIDVAFPNYQGNGDYESSIRYIMNQFLSTNYTPKQIYTHFGSALDAISTHAIWRSCCDMFLQSYINSILCE